MTMGERAWELSAYAREPARGACLGRGPRRRARWSFGFTRTERGRTGAGRR